MAKTVELLAAAFLLSSALVTFAFENDFEAEGISKSVLTTDDTCLTENGVQTCALSALQSKWMGKSIAPDLRAEEVNALQMKGLSKKASTKDDCPSSLEAAKASPNCTAMSDEEANNMVCQSDCAMIMGDVAAGSVVWAQMGGLYRRIMGRRGTHGSSGDRYCCYGEWKPVNTTNTSSLLGRTTNTTNETNMTNETNTTSLLGRTTNTTNETNMTNETNTTSLLGRTTNTTNETNMTNETNTTSLLGRTTNTTNETNMTNETNTSSLLGRTSK